MTKELIKTFLEAFAEGDAYGKATEYCSRKEIKEKLGTVKELLPPEKSLTHQDLRHGQVTDDTEQNIYLLREYLLREQITAENTAHALLDWINGTDALKYIGPSSLRALEAIRNGADINTAGRYGTTCGGIMRAPAAALLCLDEEQLKHSIVECLKPTHNTSIAIEAAMAYGYALKEAASDNSSIKRVIEKAKAGAEIGARFGYKEMTAGVSPRVSARLSFIENLFPHIENEEQLKEFLYDILGTTLASYDVACSVFAVFMYTKGDVMEAVRISTELGGDTDTIAALAAGLCAMYSKKHNIPQKDIRLIETVNQIDFDSIAESISRYIKKVR